MKLQRAEEHFGQLRLETALFLARNPYRMLLEDDPNRDGRAFLFRVKIIEHPPLEKWSSLIGECAHALRSALDHTAYLLVNRSAMVSESKPSFPILDHPDKWRAAHPNNLPGVAKEPLALIERLQPYNRSAPGEVLLNVHQLDITDKHRRLNLVNSTVIGTRWEVKSGGNVIDEESGIGPFVDGAVVGRFTLVPDVDEKMDVQQNFIFGIAMGEGEPGAGIPVLPMLERYRAMIGGIVSLFEEFL